MLVISVGDVGTALRDTVTDDDGAVDLTLATSKIFNFTKPDGTIVNSNGSFYTNGSDGIVQYTTQTGDIDIPGLWQYTITVIFATGQWTSPSPIYFQVEERQPWEDEMLAILRVLIWDMDTEDALYEDSRLKRILVVSGQYVGNELEFSQSFACNSVDLSITPDPTATATRDENFINLTCLKAACTIDRGTANLAAGQAARVKDGPTDVDLRELWKARLSLLDKGSCKAYQEAKDQYLSSGTVAFAAILSPFRLYSQYGRPYYAGYGVR